MMILFIFSNRKPWWLCPLGFFVIKWKKDKLKKNKIFLGAYKNSSIKLINKDNYKSFVL
jgi:hypothetical protein